MLIHRRILGPSFAAAFLIGCGAADRDDGRAPSDAGAVKQTVRLIPDAPGVSLAFSPDGRALAAAAARDIRLYDVASGRELDQVEIRSEASEICRFVAFSPDGKRLASVHEGGRIDLPRLFVHLWEVTADRRLKQARTLLARKHGDADAVNVTYHVSFSPDGSSAASGSPDGTVYVWETDTGKERLRFPGGVAVAFGPDGKTLISVTHDGAVRRWESATGEPLGPGKEAERTDFLAVSAAAFSADGTRAAVNDGYLVSVRDVAGGNQLRRVAFPRGIASMAFSPDGKTLVVSAADGIRLLNGASGEERGWRRAGGAVAFSGDGQHVAWSEGEAAAVRELKDVLNDLRREPEQVTSEPPGLAMRAELVARQDTYVLDLGDRARGEYSRLDPKRPFPPAPEVDLEFRVRNTSDQKLTIGIRYKPDLVLCGDGAINLRYPVQTGVIEGADKDLSQTTLAPGETYSFRVTNLDCGRGAQSNWLLPGTYTVHAELFTWVLPAPEGVEKKDDGSGWGTIRSAPVELKVLDARR